MKDFFISYNGVEKKWAEWIAWQLEGAGYSTTLQAWDFRPGYNFVLEMDKATKEAERTIAVLSPDYFKSNFTPSEWAVAFKKDPKGEKRLIVPIMVRECELEGQLSTICYINLIGLDEDDAKETLLNGVKFERAKPSTSPGFPGSRSVSEEPRFPSALPPIWNVPFLRNPNFTGRRELLERLHDDLNPDKYTDLIAITGLGGVGKTQLALEYAYRHKEDYDVLWWVRSEEPANLASDYANLAIKLDLPEKTSTDQRVIIEAVRTWLEQNDGWLLIFDNAHDPKDVGDYLPRTNSGHVIVTSRNPNWNCMAKTLSVDAFNRNESVHFILMRTGQDDYNIASVLAEELGDLPLALAQAGAYINETNISLEDYINLYKDKRIEFLEHFKSFDYNNTLATTWEISFRKVKLESRASADLLNLCAFLAQNAIPKYILTKNLDRLPESLAFGLKDPLNLDETVHVLLRYGFIAIMDDMLSVNRLVQEVTRYRMSVENRKIWSSAAINLLKDTFPSQGYDWRSWPLCSLLLSHALVAARHAEDLGVVPEETGFLLGNVALYQHQRAAFLEAKKLFERALEIDENAYGPDHPNVARDVNNLGSVLQDMGKLKEAKKLYERTLEIDENAYVLDHPNVAAAVNNLGLVLQDLGKLEEAKKHFERALEIDEKAYGKDHPSVARDVNNLGSVLQDLGKLEEAKKHFERALEIDENAYEPDHPSVATIANNLGYVLRAQGKLEEAKKHFERALEIDENAYGPDHPSVATIANNLGYVLQDLGKLEEAKKHFERALEINENAYEPNVARTAEVLDNRDH